MSNHLKDANKYWFEMSKSSLSTGKKTWLWRVERNIWFRLLPKNNFPKSWYLPISYDILNFDKKFKT